jgi:hypothetical protein
MINLDTLDILIAIVTVLLALSLVVQAVQAGIKKLFKIKSRQLEESLVDLFENVIDPMNTPAADRFRLPTMRLLPFVKHPAQLASQDVQKVYAQVMGKFQEIGRVSSRGKQMFDSISKEDLMKVLRKVSPDLLLPGSDFLKRLQTAFTQVTALETAIRQIKTSELSGEASAKFAAMQETLTPLLNDIRAIYDGNQINANLLLSDLLDVRQINLDEVLALLGDVQKKAASDLSAAQANLLEAQKAAAAGAPGDAAASKPIDPVLELKVQSLTELDQGLKQIAVALTSLRQQLDAALARLRLRLGEIENWYDTVMHSFEERYTRGMKTYAFIISLMVAVWLNANILSIYHDISTNEAHRAAVVAYGPEALKRYEEAQAKAIAEQKPEVAQNLQQQIDSTKKEISTAAAAFTSFGFKPLGEEFRDLSKLNRQEGLWRAIQHLLYMLCGWIIMAALLSVGAPFWQDTLESLFGIKNLLRKRSDTKNVEQEPGAGQTRS